MSYSVEVRVNTYEGGLIPHTFLFFNDGTNEFAIGFAPEVTGLTGPGLLHDDIAHRYDASSGQLPLTEEQYNSLLNYVGETAANPPYYNLPLGEQCTVWAVRGLVEAGVIPPYLGPYPNNGDLTSALLSHFFGFAQTVMFNPYTQKIGFEVNDLWQAFKNWVAPRRDPLILDLDGDGIETVGINAVSNVVFDYDGDGLKTGTGWIAGDDGFVVLDRNGNGTIDNGGELFGDQTLVNGVKAVDGFAALTGEDSNHDGKFDANDANYANVRIWQDVNQDGVSQADELHTLTELGIASINLTSTATNTITNGNVQTHSGTYTKTNGTTGDSGTLGLIDETGAAGNLNFDQNPFYSEFTNHLTLTQEALALPDMQGSGLVRDLREASTLSTGLTSTLSTLKNTYTTHDEMMAQIDTLLVQWAGTSTMATSVQQVETVNGKMLVYLPTQSGADFDLYFKMLGLTTASSEGVSVLGATPEEQQRWAYLSIEQVRITTMISTLERFNGETFVTIEPENVTAGSGTIVATRTSTATAGSGAVLIDPRVFIGLSAAQVSFLEQSYNALKQSVYDGLVLQTRLSGYMDAMELTIDENGLGIDDSGVIAKLSTLVITDPENAMADALELRKNAMSSLESLGWNSNKFVDKMLMITDGVYDSTALFASYGIALVDGVYDSGSGNDVIWGKQRNDTIDAGNGSDTVDGGEGDDNLYTGQYGVDKLTGGTGNDILDGGSENDTYVFNRGDGKDTVYDGMYRRGTIDAQLYNNRFNAGNDTIEFGIGITANDLVAKTVGDNLIIALKEEGKTFDQLSDTITIENWYHVHNRIENISFADGTTLSGASAFLGLMSTSGKDTIIGTEQGETLNGGLGIDTLKGGAGNDTYVVDNIKDLIVENANEGTDTIQSSVTYTLGANLENLTLLGTSAIKGTGNELNNILTGNSAANTLDGKVGADTMIGGAGNDTYVVDNTGDVVIENASEGTDRVNASVTYVLGANIENLQLTGTANINATGNSVNNTLYASIGNNGIDGGAGTDTLSYYYATAGINVNLALTTAQTTGGSGNDTIINIENLIGSSYSDNFIGSNSANALTGGKGADTLQGGKGNDTYSFNIGDGIDSIFDYDMGANTTSGGTDTLKFGTGITKSSVALYKNGLDLILSYGATDTITISNQSVANNAIEKFTLSDGNYLTSANIDTIIQSMSAYAASHEMAIESMDTVRNNQDLMTIIAGAWHK